MSIVAITPRMKPAPKIEIDKAKCTVPMDCRRCIEICGQAVFEVAPTSIPRLVEQDHRKPGTYAVRATYRYACTQCNDCIDVCPEGAITITSQSREGEPA